SLRLLLVLLVLQSPWIVGFVFVAASGRHARASIASLTSSVVGLVLAMLLVHRFGTAGVVGGLIIGDVVACAHFVVRAACDLVGEAYALFALRLWSCLVIVSAAALFSGWAAHVAVGGHFAFRWLVVGLSTSLATGATAWALWLTSDDRELLSRDRKSTRLNSSHGSISYAVFCLKKKSKKKDSSTQRASGQTDRRPQGVRGDRGESQRCRR